METPHIQTTPDNSNSLNRGPSHRMEDLLAAEDLVRSDPILNNDKHTLAMLDNGGTVNGKPVEDIGHFLAARRAIIELERIKRLDPELLNQAMVAHSTPWQSNEGVA